MFNVAHNTEPVSTCNIAAGMTVTHNGATGIVQQVMMSSHPRIGIGLIASVMFAGGSTEWLPVWMLTAVETPAIINPLDTVIVTDGITAEFATVLVVRRRTVLVQLVDYPDEYLEFHKQYVFAVAPQVTQ